MSQKCIFICNMRQKCILKLEVQKNGYCVLGHQNVSLNNKIVYVLSSIMPHVFPHIPIHMTHIYFFG
jgi:hypothetical protein